MSGKKIMIRTKATVFYIFTSYLPFMVSSFLSVSEFPSSIISLQPEEHPFAFLVPVCWPFSLSALYTPNCLHFSFHFEEYFYLFIFCIQNLRLMFLFLSALQNGLLFCLMSSVVITTVALCAFVFISLLSVVPLCLLLSEH